ESPMDDIKSMLNMENTKAPTIKDNIYRIKKARILNTISPVTALLLYLTGNTALGCKALLNSKNPFLIRIKCLTTLTPPEVLPAEPPRNMSPKKNTNNKGVHKV